MNARNARHARRRLVGLLAILLSGAFATPLASAQDPQEPAPEGDKPDDPKPEDGKTEPKAGERKRPRRDRKKKERPEKPAKDDPKVDGEPAKVVECEALG